MANTDVPRSSYERDARQQPVDLYPNKAADPCRGSRRALQSDGKAVRSVDWEVSQGLLLTSHNGEGDGLEF